MYVDITINANIDGITEFKHTLMLFTVLSAATVGNSRISDATVYIRNDLIILDTLSFNNLKLLLRKIFLITQ